MKKRIVIFTALAFITGAALATIATVLYFQQSQPRSDFVFHGATNWSMIGYVKENPTANKTLTLYNANDACTLRIDERTGTADIHNAIEERQEAAQNMDEQAMIPLGTVALSMKIPARDVAYELHKFERRYENIAIAQVPLDNGYVEIAAGCNDKKDLPNINDVLKAVEYKPVINEQKTTNDTVKGAVDQISNREDTKQAVWEQLPPTQQKRVTNWKDATTSKVILKENVAYLNDNVRKVYIGKEVYLISFPTEDIHESIPVYTDINSAKIIGYGFVD